MSVQHQIEWIRGRRLVDEDEREVRALLALDPLVNVQLRERLSDAPLSAAPFFGIERDGDLAVIAMIAPSVHIAVASDLSRSETAYAGALIATEILRRAMPLRAIIAPAQVVDPLWNELQSRVPAPPVDRRRQPIYGLDLPPGGTLSSIRLAVPADLARLVPACAAMYREEVGIDPLERDPKWYAERIRDLVFSGRSFVMVRDGEILFKCEIAAETEDAVQLMGVWTRPDRRRAGIARQGLSEVIGYIGSFRKSVTLFVNDFNRPAIDLYESLGFRIIGVNRALIW